MNSKISIVVPVYNVSEYLRECLDSILNQTYSNLQVILVDDGSTDESGAICDRYSEKYDFIEVCHKKNGGLVSARKAGLEHATGDYVGFVDADDYIHPELYECLYAEMAQSGSKFVHSCYIEDNGDDMKEIITVSPARINIGSKDERRKVLSDYLLHPKEGCFIYSSIWSKLFQTEFIKKVYSNVPDEQQYGEDLIALIYMLLYADKVSLIDRSEYVYCVRPDSLSRKKRNIIKEDFELCNCISKIYNDYKELFDENDYWWFIQDRMKYSLERRMEMKFNLPHFFFENVDMLKGKRIALYGAGKVAEDYYIFLLRNGIRISEVFDKRGNEVKFPYTMQIKSIDEINEASFDYLIIAVNSESVAKEIVSELSEKGLDSKKIIWKKPINYFDFV